MGDFRAVAKTVRELSWYKCKVILEEHGYAVYHWEPKGELQHVILEDIRIGNIEPDYVQLVAEGGR